MAVGPGTAWYGGAAALAAGPGCLCRWSPLWGGPTRLQTWEMLRGRWLFFLRQTFAFRVMPGRATALREEAFKHLNAASRAGISPLLINAAAGFYTSQVNPWLSGGRGAHPEHQPQASAVPGPTAAPRQHRAGTHGCPTPALCRLGWGMHPVGALKAKPGHLCEQLPSPPRAKAAEPLSGRFSADVLAAGT